MLPVIQQLPYVTAVLVDHFCIILLVSKLVQMGSTVHPMPAYLAYKGAQAALMPLLVLIVMPEHIFQTVIV